MIIAVDFDGTLCEDKFPSIGKPNNSLITQLIDKQSTGDKLILWTCRTKNNLADAIKWCATFGLFFDAINDNLQEVKTLYGGDSRKIFADVYIDDRAKNPISLSL